MTRWVIERTRHTLDNEKLQVVTTFKEGENKECHKALLRGYSYKRFCLIPRNHEDSVSYHCK